MQKVSFADEARVWSFGYEIEGQAKVTKRYEFGPKLRWVGIHGIESNTGIEKLGIITMDPTCVPLGGVLQIKEKEKKDDDAGGGLLKPIDSVIEPVTVDSNVRPEVEKSEWGLALIIFVVVLILTIGLIVICVRVCVRWRRQ